MARQPIAILSRWLQDVVITSSGLRPSAYKYNSPIPGQATGGKQISIHTRRYSRRNEFFSSATADGISGLRPVYVSPA
jgi:hypothetical protein